MRHCCKNKYLIIICFSLVILFLTACTNGAYTPREGDLLFVATSSTDFSKAITDATTWDDSLKYSHVAMVAEENGGYYVLEASSERGVVRTEWDDFVRTSASGESCIVGMRLAVDYPVKEAVARAKAHLGEPYDWSYLPDNGKMYCSELIYESYRAADGSPLFTARPMNFRDADGNLPVFWIRLFEELGESIPEGVLGTNPNDLAKEGILVEVCRFPFQR